MLDLSNFSWGGVPSPPSTFPSPSPPSHFPVYNPPSTFVQLLLVGSDFCPGGGGSNPPPPTPLANPALLHMQTGGAVRLFGSYRPFSTYLVTFFILSRRPRRMEEAVVKNPVELLTFAACLPRRHPHAPLGLSPRMHLQIQYDAIQTSQSDKLAPGLQIQ